MQSIYLAGRDPLAHVLPVGVVVVFVGVVQQPRGKVLPPHGVHALREQQELHLVHLGLQVHHEPAGGGGGGGRGGRGGMRDCVIASRHRVRTIVCVCVRYGTCGSPGTAACSDRAGRRRGPAALCSRPPRRRPASAKVTQRSDPSSASQTTKPQGQGRQQTTTNEHLIFQMHQK